LAFDISKQLGRHQKKSAINRASKWICW
jgi:hypothetical protein